MEQRTITTSRFLFHGSLVPSLILADLKRLNVNLPAILYPPNSPCYHSLPFFTCSVQLFCQLKTIREVQILYYSRRDAIETTQLVDILENFCSRIFFYKKKLIKFGGRYQKMATKIESSQENTDILVLN